MSFLFLLLSVASFLLLSAAASGGGSGTTAAFSEGAPADASEDGGSSDGSSGQQSSGRSAQPGGFGEQVGGFIQAWVAQPLRDYIAQPITAAAEYWVEKPINDYVAPNVRSVAASTQKGAEAFRNVVLAEGDEPVGTYAGGVSDIFSGYGDAVTSTASGIWFLFSEFPTAVEGLWHAAKHPVSTYDLVMSDVLEASQTNRGKGNIIGDGLIAAATAGAVKTIKESGFLGQMAEKLPFTRSSRLISAFSRSIVNTSIRGTISRVARSTLISKLEAKLGRSIKINYGAGSNGFNPKTGEIFLRGADNDLIPRGTFFEEIQHLIDDVDVDGLNPSTIPLAGSLWRAPVLSTTVMRVSLG